MTSKVVCVSGYFDPCAHVGHLELFERAKKLGDKLYVIVNNDHQAGLKKGGAIVPAAERVRMIRALACVDAVFIASDRDRTVCETLRQVAPDIFANAGDVNPDSPAPEAEVCAELGIEMVYGLGDKIQSCRWIMDRAKMLYYI